eukprot:6187205-Pleurochrysis_carterae.AAC.1
MGSAFYPQICNETIEDADGSITSKAEGGGWSLAHQTCAGRETRGLTQSAVGERRVYNLVVGGGEHVVPGVIQLDERPVGSDSMRMYHSLVTVEYVVALGGEDHERLDGDGGAGGGVAAQERVHSVDAAAVADGDGDGEEGSAVGVEVVLREELQRPGRRAAASEDLRLIVPDSQFRQQ